MVCNIGLAINVLTNRGHPLQKNVRNLIYVIEQGAVTDAGAVLGSEGKDQFGELVGHLGWLPVALLWLIFSARLRRAYYARMV